MMNYSPIETDECFDCMESKKLYFISYLSENKKMIQNYGNATVRIDEIKTNNLNRILQELAELFKCTKVVILFYKEINE